MLLDSGTDVSCRKGQDISNSDDLTSVQSHDYSTAHTLPDKFAHSRLDSIALYMRLLDNLCSLAKTSEVWA